MLQPGYADALLGSNLYPARRPDHTDAMQNIPLYPARQPCTAGEHPVHLPGSHASQMHCWAAPCTLPEHPPEATLQQSTMLLRAHKAPKKQGPCWVPEAGCPCEMQNTVPAAAGRCSLLSGISAKQLSLRQMAPAAACRRWWRAVHAAWREWKQQRTSPCRPTWHCTVPLPLSACWDKDMRCPCTPLPPSHAPAWQQLPALTCWSPGPGSCTSLL